MRSSFTPGAQRALSAAAAWTSYDESDGLGLPEILLGLLAEPECRAALILARHKVDADAVRSQFSALRPVAENNAAEIERSDSPAWLNCLRAAEDLLAEYPRPLELATEHLLLGLVATDNEVARWLGERGLAADQLEAEVHRLSGHQPGPLPLEVSDDDLELSDEEVSQHVVISNRRAGEAAAAGFQLAAMRILDAAANRAGEGLRVIEDYLRFQLDDRHLTSLCKGIRHELTTVLRVYSSGARHAARDTRADVGTSVSVPAEQARGDLEEVLTANFKRVEQSLRSLEEYSKTLVPHTAAHLEQLRYRVYTLERLVGITRGSLQRLAAARLYVLIDGGSSEDAFAALAEGLIAAEVSVLQLRDKNLPDRQMLERARTLRALTQGTSTLFIMNDRPDLAALSGADGVHVGQDELTVKDARRVLGPDRLVGVSTHSLEQARSAVLDGADYIGVGPTFPSGTKKFAEFTGTELLRAVAPEIRLPAFAIGGIDAKNLAEVLATGITRVAVSGAVTSAKDPVAAARELLRILTKLASERASS
jgi:thiamine-phosphate pyrophosphorylase